eukprot:Platyproteum_vivax@DN4868_c0_g1_i1.p1
MLCGIALFILSMMTFTSRAGNTSHKDDSHLQGQRNIMGTSILLPALALMFAFGLTATMLLSRQKDSDPEYYKQVLLSAIIVDAALCVMTVICLAVTLRTLFHLQNGCTNCNFDHFDQLAYGGSLSSCVFGRSDCIGELRKYFAGTPQKITAADQAAILVQCSKEQVCYRDTDYNCKFFEDQSCKDAGDICLVKDSRALFVFDQSDKSHSCSIAKLKTACLIFFIFVVIANFVSLALHLYFQFTHKKQLPQHQVPTHSMSGVEVQITTTTSGDETRTIGQPLESVAVAEGSVVVGETIGAGAVKNPNTLGLVTGNVVDGAPIPSKVKVTPQTASSSSEVKKEEKKEEKKDDKKNDKDDDNLPDAL